MKNRICFIFSLVFAALFLVSGSVWAQAKGHASVGLGHGEEGYLQLEEMIKHLEFSLKMSDADPTLVSHTETALVNAREALKKYDAALTHASEALGRPSRVAPSGEGSGGGGESHSHEEGSGHSQKNDSQSYEEGSRHR